MKKITQTIGSIFFLIISFIAIITAGILCLILRIISEKASFAMSAACMKFLRIIAGCKLDVKGLEKLDPKQNYIFTANHQSYFDIVVLYSALNYKLSFIAKTSLFMIPIFGWAMLTAGHIPINRSNPRKAKKSIDNACKRIIKKNQSILAFPEGTRSATGELGDFKLGILSIAKKVGIPIVPITINGARDVLPKKSIMVKPAKVEVIIADPIPKEEYIDKDKFTMGSRLKEIISENHNLTHNSEKISAAAGL